MGFVPSLCFHPGTQCNDPQAWASYVTEAARIAALAGVRLARLNIGGGFAANRGFGAPDHRAIFTTINSAVKRSFAGAEPRVLCEPGRAMVADACVLATRVKGMRSGGEVVFLNDGIYGGLPDLRDMGLSGLVHVLGPAGPRSGAATPRIVFGPTCDSLDRLPDGLPLPDDTAVGDYVMFGGMGAYSIAMSTGFNGYGVGQNTLAAMALFEVSARRGSAQAAVNLGLLLAEWDTGFSDPVLAYGWCLVGLEQASDEERSGFEHDCAYVAELVGEAAVSEGEAFAAGFGD